jgi:hypothetical protein
MNKITNKATSKHILQYKPKGHEDRECFGLNVINARNRNRPDCLYHEFMKKKWKNILHFYIRTKMNV